MRPARIRVLDMKRLVSMIIAICLSTVAYSQYTQYKCSNCNGYGKWRCSNCNGNGSVVVPMLDPYTGYYRNVRTTCVACAGYGVIYCRVCGGYGVVRGTQPSFGGSLGCNKCGCKGWAGSTSGGGTCGRKIGAGKYCTHKYSEHKRASGY